MGFDATLPFWKSLGAKLFLAVLFLMVATVVVFSANVGTLRTLKVDAPTLADRIARVEWLQYSLGAANVVVGVLLLVFVRRVIEREQNAAREPRLRAIMNNTSDAVVTIDEHGTILDVNETTEKLFGYPADELVGHNVSILAASPHADAHNSYVQRYIRTGKARVIGVGRTVPGQHKDGTVFPVNIRVTEQRGSHGRIFIGILQDLRAETARTKLIESTKESVNQLATASAELLAITSQQATNSEDQASSLTETVSTINEITQSAEHSALRVRSVADSSRRADELGKAGRKAIDDTIDAMNAARQKAESIAESILELAEQAQTIGDIITTVNEIAEQTHLLALNAAIEASRAGEHGRGFSVVAAEVRGLAEQSKKATQKVRHILGQIQKSTNVAVISAEDGAKTVQTTVAAASRAGETIKVLSDMLGDASDSAAQIAAAAGQQATGMTQINVAMRSFEQAVRQNVVAVSQVEQAATDLTKLSERLRDMLSKFGE